jgi:hypothetical protein
LWKTASEFLKKKKINTSGKTLVVEGFQYTLIENKIKLFSYIRKLRGIECKVIYD